MSDVESVAISFNNSLIAVNLTVSPGSGSNVCSRKLHRKINRGFFNGTDSYPFFYLVVKVNKKKRTNCLILFLLVAEARLELTTFGL